MASGLVVYLKAVVSVWLWRGRDSRERVCELSWQCGADAPVDEAGIEAVGSLASASNVSVALPEGRLTEVGERIVEACTKSVAHGPVLVHC
jgi:hypothetical protein